MIQDRLVTNIPELNPTKNVKKDYVGQVRTTFRNRSSKLVLESQSPGLAST